MPNPDERERQSGLNKVVCGWCNSTLKDGDESLPVSHGICDPCKQKHFRVLPSPAPPPLIKQFLPVG